MIKSLNSLRKFISVLFLVFIAIFFYYIISKLPNLNILFNFSWSLIYLIGVLFFIILLLRGFINYYFFVSFNIYLSLNESIGLAAVNTLANQLPFIGGLIAKGLYLKRIHQLNYLSFLSSNIPLYVLFISLNGFIGLFIIFYWHFIDNINISFLLFLFYILMSFSFIVVFFPIKAGYFPKKTKKYILKIINGWTIFSGKPLLVGRILLLQGIITCLFAARFWLSFRSLSHNISFIQCIFLASATVLSRIINIIPGNIGIREAIIASLSSSLGFNPGISIIAVGIDRIITTIFMFLIGSIYTFILSYKAKLSFFSIFNRE